MSARATDAFAWDDLASTPALQLGVGEEVVAPTIDLAASVNVFRLEVVDEHGLPISRGTVTFWAPTNQATADLAIVDGLAIVRTRHDAVVAWLGAPGRRSVQLPELSGDARVELLPAYRVRVRLTGPAASLPEPCVLWIRATSGLGHDKWVLRSITDVGRVAFDRSGHATLEVAVARTFRYSLSVTGDAFDSRGRRTHVSLPRGESDALLVEDRDGEQLIEIALDPGALAQALAQLEG